AANSRYPPEIGVGLFESAIRLFRERCRGAWGGELQVIEGIHEISAEPDAIAFTPAPVLVQRDVPVVDARTIDNPAWRRPEVGYGWSKRRGIEPLCDGVWAIRVPYQVRPGVSPNREQVATLCNCKREPAPEVVDAGYLPPAKYAPQRSNRILGERYLPHIVDRYNMRSLKRGRAPLILEV